MALQFIRYTTWKTLIVMVFCGLCFYFLFNGIIKKNKTHETVFIIEIIEESLSEAEMEAAMAGTLAVYKSRTGDIGMANVTIQQGDERRIFISIPGVIKEQEANHIKQILTKQDRIAYRLAVYGPIKK